MNKFEWERLTIAQPFNGDALRVLWCYCTHADAETMITFPKIRDVADMTGISVERVGKFRTKLLESGWLIESTELTTRGNPKLQLAVGEEIDQGYLGVKRRMNTNSMKNLVPAAYQKLKALDSPDEAGLGDAGRAGLEDAGAEPLDSPDVTTSELNNQFRTTNNNQRQDVPVSASASTDPSGIDSKLEEGSVLLDSWSCHSPKSELSEGLEVIEFTKVQGFDGYVYSLSNTGVGRKLEPEEVKPEGAIRRAAHESKCVQGGWLFGTPAQARTYAVVSGTTGDEW